MTNGFKFVDNRTGGVAGCTVAGLERATHDKGDRE